MTTLRIYMIAALSLLASAAYSQTSNDTTKVSVLEEVVITSERFVHKGDHDVLYLSNDNRRFGTNALDAVSSLTLFQTSINETKLTSFDRREVYILINGVPSTPYDLRAYKGDDIKNVEYYAVAPPQYMGLTDGPVVNIIMKKRHDRSYSGYFNTSNAVNTGFGTNQADLTYADSLNQVKLGYLIDYRNINKISNQTDYIYNPDLGSNYKGTMHYKGEYHNISASYQRYQGNHLFNAKLYSIIDPMHEWESRIGTIKTEGKDYLGNGRSNLKSNSNTYAIDLYYRYLLKKKRSFAINVVNTFGTSYSESEKSMISDNVPSSDYDYDIHSNADNESYSLIANAVFTSPFWGGSVKAGSRYEYKQLEQVSYGKKYIPYSNEEFLNAGGSWRWKIFSFCPSVGLNIMKQSSVNITETSVLPFIGIYSDWWGEGKMKGASVQFTMKMRNVSPSLGQLTESVTYLDPWLVSVGDPDLKDNWITSVKLSLCYFAPKNKNKVVFTIQPSYAHNKIATAIVRNDKNVFLRPHHIGGDFGCGFYLFGSWYPFKWLELSPYVEYYISRFETPSQKVNFNYLRAGGKIVASYNNLSLIFAINSPTKEYDGDLLSRGSFQSAGIIQYKFGNWSVGAQYSYLGHNDYDLADLPTFRYYKNKDWKPLQHLVRLTATYTFSIGRSRRHANRTLNESSKDNTGLSKFNTPQMSK